MVGKRIWWENKKAAVRHFLKFHFGLADRCAAWWVNFYLYFVYCLRLSDKTVPSL